MNITKVFEKEFNRMKERGWDCIYILLDIHGTIFVPSYNNEETYEFYPYAKEALQKLSERKDIKIILWSSTDRKTLNKYHIELCNNDIYVDYFNANPEVDGSDCSIKTASFKHKPYFNIGIDDRFGFEPEKDWANIYSWLCKKEIDAKLNQVKDKNGNILKIGDMVHDKWGYDLTVCYSENMGWYGMLVCDDNDSCKDIPYALNEDEITLIRT